MFDIKKNSSQAKRYQQHNHPYNWSWEDQPQRNHNMLKDATNDDFQKKYYLLLRMKYKYSF